MNINSDENNDLRERSHRVLKGNKGVNDGVVGEDQNLVEDDGLKANGISENVKDEHEMGAIQAPDALQIHQQQQSQGSVVCWERFLHLRSLKVLLVENDYSTRNVVTALLRNCGYEVIEAANGLQAWKILEDLTNHVDLVLTEVVMPCVSGVGLLCKIMSHKTRKNVPVIMMSSHDSMGLVFKCLSKGAVDFLVKPIRKNELRNLWQHVWRRCHSSSGSGSASGSESGTQQTQKSVKSKGIEKSGNNSGSNDEDDNGSNGLNVGDGSDDGSGTQSSWTKQAVEIDSPRPVSPWDQVAECPDSTCAQVIHSNAEISANKQVTVIGAKERQEQEVQLGIVASGKDLDIRVLRNVDLLVECPVEDSSKLAVNKLNKLLLDKELLDLNSEGSSGDPKYETANLTSCPTNTDVLRMDTTEFEAPNRHSKVSDAKNKAIADTKEVPNLELSLKRLRGVKDDGLTVHDDRNVLRRSDSSAFSRYNAVSNPNKGVDGKIKSGSPHDTSLDIMKRRSAYDLQSHSNGDHPNQCSNVGSNNIDMGSTTNKASTKSVVLKNKSAVTSVVKCLHPPSTFQPINCETQCPAQQIVSAKADGVAGTALLSQPSVAHQECQIQHLAQSYDHQHHILQNMQQQHQPQEVQSDHDDASLKKMAATAPHCGSSNVMGGPVEGNACYYSINGSASGSNHGSNHGSNGQNGSSTAVNAGATNMESDNGIARKSGSGDASGSGSGSGTGNRGDQNNLAHREATLTKFRQKRTERCFRKKVRYQNRKRLAEQRPRIRGQFVRQTSNDNTMEREQQRDN